MNANGTGAIDLTPSVAEPVIGPTFSPDGKQIAFTVDTNPGPGTLYSVAIMNVDGSGITDLTPANAEFERRPDFSPDGSRIVFERDEPAASKLFTINPDGSGLTPLSPPGNVFDWSAAFSPSGTRLAWSRDQDVTAPPLGTNIFVGDAALGGATNITTAAGAYQFKQDPSSPPTGPRSCSPHMREWERAASSWSTPTAGR